MIKKILGAILLTLSLSVVAQERYDRYVYFGDMFTLNIHSGNYIMVKHENQQPILLNGGEPYSTDRIEIDITPAIDTGEYKILELRLVDGKIDDFWETTVYVSEHRSCFGPLQMVSFCSNK